MKPLYWLSILLSSVLVITCRQAPDEHPALLAVPIKLVDGYGPFHPGFSQLENEFHDNPGREEQWGKTRLAVTGIPEHWTRVEKSMVWLNANQLVYQNYLAGNIPLKRYQDLQESWKWTPDETRLSKKPIKCYVYTLRGYDAKEGKWAVMIDTNNNLNFSDEKVIYPKPIDNKNPYVYQNPMMVHYEVYQKGRVEAAQIPMVVKTYNDLFLYNFPQYATAVVEREGKTYELVINSGFTKPDFERTGLVQKSAWSWSKQEKVKPEDVVELRENITLGGVRYKNKGVDLYNNVLQLDPLGPGDKEYSLQVGYPFRPFAEKEFGTGKSISLANYKGKYVYVDFWGTWCKGCVEDMPALKQIYQKLDKNRFAFLGIVAEDSPERLATFVKKQGIGWPQIFSDNQNKLVDAYFVTGYPTSVLLDPNGTVIAKNLRPEALQARIAELSR